MGKKGRKTRWRKLPIQIGTNSGRGTGCEKIENDEPKRNYQQTQQETVPSKFNEDEYTKITTPRQDMLFKKGHFGRKKTTVPLQDTTESQSAAGDSVESESYMGDETGNPYAWGGPMDPSGMYYMNNGYEMFDPYTGAVATVIVAPGPMPPYGPPAHNGHQILAAVPCGPIPLQPLEWFNPALQQLQPYHTPNMNHLHEKRSSCDSLVNCSGPNSESTGAFDTPPELMKGDDDATSPLPYHPQYIYPGAYMFGAPMYNMNGLNVQGVMQPCIQPQVDPKRRKKRRKRRRGGAVTDEGSESSCEENMSCEAGNESQSGSSSDTALGSSSSKTNSDSGIHVDQMPNSGSDSPQNYEPPYSYPTSTVVSPVDDCNYEVAEVLPSDERVVESSEAVRCTAVESRQEPLCLVEAISSVRIEELTLEADIPEESISGPDSYEKTLDEVAEETIIGEEQGDNSTDNAQILLNDSNTSIPKSTEDDSIEESHPSDSIEESLPSDSAKEMAEPLISTLTDVEPEERKSADISLVEVETEPITVVELDAYAAAEKSEDDAISVHQNDVEDEEVPAVCEVLASEAPAELEEVEVEEKVEEKIEIEEKASELTIVDSRASLEDDASIVPLTDPGDPEPPDEPPVSHRISMADKPITEAVTRWLENQGASALAGLSEDEGIEEGVDPLYNATGQKNGEGNPFLASSLSGARTRVAETVSSSDWEFDRESRRRKAMCDAKSSVDKYYRLAADQSTENKTSNKTVLRMGQEVPFPCGVCCILQ
ncbi:Hypothetical protein NTJ_11600 [Nesidiocoris tenuis]|uniref:Uncharacterized protein n=1 Tax=Nesidiocoris tenuis TaxID=355587 RepID=A0ABN7B2Z5_9HEMI|nr:Hypothetical protein NTJ_11600 [Nesidiocoris tenuis]